MKKLNLLILILAAFCGPRLANADSAGTTLFNFLSFDTNPRAIALGGAYTALAADSGALSYNPAGLAMTKRPEASFMHNQYFQGITQEYLSYASAGGWGADFNYLSFGGISQTTLDNHTGAGLGDVGLWDMAFGLGLADELDDGLLGGAGLKIVRESIAGNSVNGFMLDGGLLWNVPGADGLDLGLAVQNLGPDVKTQGGNEPLPMGVRAGAGYRTTLAGMKTLFSADVQQNRGEDFGMRFGCELLFAGAVPLRLGYKTLTDDGAGISAGIGYSFGDMSFDYAFAPYKELGDTHRLAVTYRWGKAPGSAAKKPAPAPAAADAPKEPALAAADKDRSAAPAAAPVHKASHKKKLPV